MAKSGRKLKRSFVTPNGVELHGLVQGKDGRFRPSGKSSPKWSGPWEVAFHKFQIWKSRESDFGELEPLDGTGLSDFLIERQRIRDMIATDPDQAAIYLEYPPLAKLANLRDLEPPVSRTLIELGRAYLDDKESELTPKEWKNSETWWNEFVEITQARKIDDLNRAAFRTYRDKIKTKQKSGKRSTVFTRSRFAKIKTIINYALKESELDFSKSDRQTLEDMSVLKLPPKPTPRPVEITKSEMAAILKVADDWDTALILVALNAAYTNIDCGRLRWPMIDLPNKLIRFDRQKSEHLTNAPLPRICALWDRTIAALQSIKSGNSFVFLSTRGRPAHIDTMYSHFKRCSVAAGITRPLSFKHIRKSALTAASNDPSVPDRQIELLAGHSSGIKENYVVRKNVSLACQAIELYFFVD